MMLQHSRHACGFCGLPCHACDTHQHARLKQPAVSWDCNLLQGDESKWRLSDSGRIPAEGELRKLATPDAWCAACVQVSHSGFCIHVCYQHSYQECLPINSQYTSVMMMMMMMMWCE